MWTRTLGRAPRAGVTREPDSAGRSDADTILSVQNAARRVLVVEDERDVRNALTHALRLLGLEAVVAADGVEGLEQLRSGTPFALILLDLRLPRLSGADLLAAMRADPALAGIPVVTMTASHDPAPDHVHAHLPKPFHLRELHDAVRAICGD